MDPCSLYWSPWRAGGGRGGEGEMIIVTELCSPEWTLIWGYKEGAIADSIKYWNLMKLVLRFFAKHFPHSRQRIELLMYILSYTPFLPVLSWLSSNHHHCRACPGRKEKPGCVLEWRSCPAHWSDTWGHTAWRFWSCWCNWSMCYDRLASPLHLEELWPVLSRIRIQSHVWNGNGNWY